MQQLTPTELILLTQVQYPASLKQNSLLTYGRDLISLLQKKLITRDKGVLCLTDTGKQRLKVALNCKVFEVQVQIGSTVTNFINSISKSGVLGAVESKAYKLAHLIARKKYNANV